MKRIISNLSQVLPYIQRAADRAKFLLTWPLYKAFAISKIPAVLPAIIFSVAITATIFLTPPFAKLPAAEARQGALLGNLLTAQAAIAALTLAVSLFVMQGTRAREDINDRLYREYLRRSWVTHIFWNSLLAVSGHRHHPDCRVHLGTSPTPPPGSGTLHSDSHIIRLRFKLNAVRNPVRKSNPTIPSPTME